MKKTTLMKKITCLFCLFLLPWGATNIQAQEELLKNPGFETWIGEALDYIDVWTSYGDKETQNTTNPDSKAAIRVTGAANILQNRLSQTIDHPFISGDIYEFVIHYYVEKSVSGNDFKIKSMWYSNSPETDLPDDSGLLNNGDTHTSNGGWTTTTIRTTAPDGAEAFIFRVEVMNKAIVLFDDFSFKKVGTSVPQITVTPATLPVFKTIAGTPVSASIDIAGSRLTSAMQLNISGTDANLFAATPASISQASATAVITYNPQTIGNHTALLTISSEGAESKTITLSGTSTSSVVTPTISVNPATPEAFSAKIGESAEQTVLVSSSDLNDYIYVSREGDGMAMFQISTTMLSKNQNDVPLKITYRPSNQGNHSAFIVFKSKGAPDVRIPVSGTSIEGEATWKENFETGVKTDYAQAYITASKGSWDLNGALLGKDANDKKNGIQAIRIQSIGGYAAMDFDKTNGIASVSLSHGSYGEDAGAIWQMQYSCDFGLTWLNTGAAQTVPAGSEGLEKCTIAVNQKGIIRIRIIKTGGTEGTSTFNIDDIQITDLPGQPADDRFNLDTTNPSILLDEHFDKVRHNKPLAELGWTNIIEAGARPWWGYTFKDDKTGKVIESVAKATAYIYQEPKNDPYKMWLITPALDFKNAASKYFTFRVMGDLLFEGQPAALELYYLDMADGSVYKNKVEMPMPSIADDNGLWSEYHIDLEGQNISDTFFMGFCLTSPSGQESPMTFYIDDVSFGRTNLPTMRTETRSLTLECEQYSSVVSAVISVTAENLTEPITISSEGANKSRFKPSVKTLPVSGGSFTVEFSPMEAGIHEAYIKIASRGAADLLIPMVGRSLQASPRILVSENQLNVVLSTGGTLPVSSEPIIANPFLLTNDIAITVEGSDKDKFSLSTSRIAADALNESFVITYHPTQTPTQHQASVRLSSVPAEDVVISVTGGVGASINQSEQGMINLYSKNNVIKVEGDQLISAEVITLTGKSVCYRTANASSIE